MRNVLVFGTGAIGEAVIESLLDGSDRVIGTSRRPEARESPVELIAVDPFDGRVGLKSLRSLPVLDAVVWAQGVNRSDSLFDLDIPAHIEVLQANCVFVSATLAELLAQDKLSDGARLCVISSIWQLLARQGKYSYVVSKAALTGLIQAGAADLAERRMLLNAVLPSVTDTPMTRSMLSPEQVADFATATGFNRLVSLDDVVSLVRYLVSDANTGITGQSIPVDLGYTVTRRV